MANHQRDISNPNYPQYIIGRDGRLRVSPPLTPGTRQFADYQLPENRQFLDYHLPEDSGFPYYHPPEDSIPWLSSNESYQLSVPHHPLETPPPLPNTLYHDFRRGLELPTSSRTGIAGSFQNDPLASFNIAQELERLRVEAALRGHMGSHSQTRSDMGLDLFPSPNPYYPPHQFSRVGNSDGYNNGSLGLFPDINWLHHAGSHGTSGVNYRASGPNYEQGRGLSNGGRGQGLIHPPVIRPNLGRNGFGARYNTGRGSLGYNTGHGSWSWSSNHPGGERIGLGGGHAGVLGSSFHGFTTWETMRGKIFSLAKDQKGYANLSEKIDEATKEQIDMIFMEVKDHVRELMVHTYGNHFIQRLFGACGEEQITEMILLVISDEEYFTHICFDTYGTRAMQKLLELNMTQEQRLLLMSVINPIGLDLSKSSSGQHIIGILLQSFPTDDIRHLVYILAQNCVDLARNQYGCCVLQALMRYVDEELKQCLVTEIIAHSLIISQDSYGNYVMQFIVTLGEPIYTEGIMAQLRGNLVSLSQDKFASNVVERLIKSSRENLVKQIIEEIMYSPNFLGVLQNDYGNFVVQTAIKCSKGDIHHRLAREINLHSAYLHSHPRGKKVLGGLRDCKHRHYF